jgi:hypothetical protein
MVATAPLAAMFALVMVAGCGFEHGALSGDDSIGSVDAFVPPPASRECRYPDPSLRLCLELDDGVLGPTLYDSSPSQLTPTAAGLTQFLHDILDGAAKTASATVISIPETPKLDISGPMTVEMWINPDHYGAAMLIENHDQYAMTLGPYGHIGCAMAGRQIFTYSEGTVAPHEWAHVACTYYGTIVRAFIDGVSTDCTLAESKIKIDGDEGTKLVPGFEGGIDGIRVYAANLTSQICTHAGKTNCQLKCP